MQVMPDTYAGLRDRYNLGGDPFDPHNNILAGTAYLREMYDRYGSPGFLAAYNAGPNRLDSYLNSGRPLPEETINYVASIAPLLGPGTPMSGPLAVYAGPVTQMASARPTPTGCDPDAAYNPNGPCTPLRQAVVRPVAQLASTQDLPPPAYSAPYAQEAAYRPGACDPDAAYDPAHPCVPVQAPAVQSSVIAERAPAYAGSSGQGDYAQVGYAQGSSAQSGCDPDAAYDPAHPCQSLPPASEAVVAEPLAPAGAQRVAPTQQVIRPAPAGRNRFAMESRPLQERMAQRVAFTPGPRFTPPPGPSPGHWAIQVGAFATLSSAQSAAESARSNVPDILRIAKIELPATTPFGNRVAFRARLAGLSAAEASDACTRLSRRGTACMAIPPSRDAF
jgi:hypothetical protein